jgi:hypothetical protein
VSNCVDGLESMDRVKDFSCGYNSIGVMRNIRKWQKGDRDPPRIRTSIRRYSGPRALLFRRLCQHRSGFAAYAQKVSNERNLGIRMLAVLPRPIDAMTIGVRVRRHTARWAG